MTIHPDIHRAIASGMDPQEAISAAWMATIPPQFRKVGTAGSTIQRSALERGTETTQARAAAVRAELAKIILPLHEQGMTVPQLSLAAKCAHATVRRILEENGQTPHVAPNGGVKHRDWDAIIPDALDMRAKGMTWYQVGKALKVCRNRLREACNAWEARQ